MALLDELTSFGENLAEQAATTYVGAKLDDVLTKQQSTDAQRAAALPVATSSTSSTMTYVLFGIGAVVLLLVVFAFAKKR